MPRPDDEIISGVADAIADGRSVAWEDVKTNADSRDILRELEVLAAVGRVHREPADTDAAMPTSPSEWGPFVLLEELGSGAFGTVYRARDVRLDRDVALKLLTSPTRREPDDATAVAEGRLLAKVRHRSIITVYGADIVDGVVGIWMELLKGRTLQEELDDRGPASATEAALIGIELCRALAAVHKAGLIHRDVKAQNVMREEGGRIVLMDFGAGRDITLATDRVSLTGTPLYMAPEVLAGGPATVASDLYSLGVLLYRLVTNDFPVYAATLDGLRAAHASGHGRLLRDVRPDLPSAFIKTVEGATAANPTERPSSAAALEHSLEEVLRSEQSGEGRQIRPFAGWYRYAMAIGAVVLAVTIGSNLTAIRDYFSPPAVGIRSIVVLPFANLSGQSDQEYLADGVTEVLIGSLAQLKSLRVISRTSAMQYKAANRPLADIARELKVDGIVEGSVARSGDRLRVTVQLLQADEHRVWGQTYERSAADLFKVQGEISNMIADAVKLSLTESERLTLAAGPAVQVQAQDAFLRGLQRLYDLRVESLKSARADLEEAVRLDPTSARAYATLSQCYLLLGTRDVLSPDEAYRNALIAATRALQLDDTVSEAHTQLAEVKFYYEWNWEWARREYERALELNANNSHALARYSIFLSAIDQPDDALRHAQLAQSLDPLQSTIRSAPAMALFYARRYDESIAAFEHLNELPPYSLMDTDRVGLARALAARGRFDEAIEQMNLAIKHGGKAAVWVAELARIQADAGNHPEARRLIASFLEPTGRSILRPANMAMVWIALGDADRAFAELNRAADERSPTLLWANVDPRFDRVRDDSRYAELIRRIGLPK